MTIPIQPDFQENYGNYGYQATNSAISNIANAIQSIIQPYKQQELGLRAAISKDPSLAQKLADLAATNPDALTALAGPNAAKYFAKLEASPETQARIAARPATKEALATPENLKYTATKEAIGVTPGQVAGDVLNEKIATLTGTALDQNPALQAGAVAKKATGTGAGTVEKQGAQARYLQSIPQISQLQQEGVLQTEFQKYLNGQQSRFSADMLNAAMDLPIGKTLLLPYVEELKTQRANALIGSRYAIADKAFGDNLDKYIVAKALDVKSKTGERATTGDLIFMMSGRQDLADQYGGTTPDGLKAAQEAFDNNGELKSKSLRATQTITNIVNSVNGKRGVPDDLKKVLLQQINEAGLELKTPVQYTLDGKGNFVQLGSDITPTTKESNAPPKIPQPSTGATPSKTGRSTTIKGSTTGAAGATAYNPPDFVKKMADAVKNMTVDELKRSATFQKLPKEAQDYLLQQTKK